MIVSNFESGVSKECPRSFSKDHRFSQKNFNRFESQEKNKVTFDRDHKIYLDCQYGLFFHSPFAVQGMQLHSFFFFFPIKVLFPSGVKVVIDRYSWGLDIVIKTPRANDANQEGGLCVYPGPYDRFISEAGFKERYEKRTSINLVPVLSSLFQFSSLDSVVKQIYCVGYLVSYLVPFGYLWRTQNKHFFGTFKQILVTKALRGVAYFVTAYVFCSEE